MNGAGAIVYLLANKTFESCCFIPVFEDVSTMKAAKEYDHKCMQPQEEDSTFEIDVDLLSKTSTSRATHDSY